MSRLARLLFSLLTLLSGGCTMSTLGLARSIDPGTTQAYLAPGVLRVQRSGAPLWTPQVELGGRYGLNERVELGARLWLPMPGYELAAKVSLLRSPDSNRGFDLAVAPGAGYLYAPGGSGEIDGSALHVVSFYLPLLVGWNTGGGNQLVIAPKLVDVLTFAGSEDAMTANLVMIGASVGYVWRVTEGLSIVPELGAGTMIASSLSRFGTDLDYGGVNAQFSVGFLFGGHAAAPQCPAPSGGQLGAAP